MGDNTREIANKDGRNKDNKPGGKGNKNGKQGGRSQVGSTTSRKTAASKRWESIDMQVEGPKMADIDAELACEYLEDRKIPTNLEND